MQVLEAVQIQRRKHSLSVAHTIKVFIKIAVPLACVLLVVCYYLLSIGYFGPLTARVRGLFVRHTRTGNPLVDSVAEHQPGSTAAYQQYMHHVYRLAPIGFVLLLRSPASHASAHHGATPPLSPQVPAPLLTLE